METTERVAQEKSNWAIEQLKECNCVIKKVFVDPEDFMFLRITYTMPIA